MYVERYKFSTLYIYNVSVYCTGQNVSYTKTGTCHFVVQNFSHQKYFPKRKLNLFLFSFNCSCMEKILKHKI